MLAILVVEKNAWCREALGFPQDLSVDYNLAKKYVGKGLSSEWVS